MAGSFGVIGCGYVGSAAAHHFRHLGLEVTGTTTSPSRLQELCDLVDHPRIYRAGDSCSDASFLDSLDGLLIAMAPTSVSMEEDQYRAVYGTGVTSLVEAIKSRQSERPLHVSYLSSAGVYGNQLGAVCDESTPTDRSNTANALLADVCQVVLDQITELHKKLKYLCLSLIPNAYKQLQFLSYSNYTQDQWGLSILNCFQSVFRVEHHSLVQQYLQIH